MGSSGLNLKTAVSTDPGMKIKSMRTGERELLKLSKNKSGTEDVY